MQNVYLEPFIPSTNFLIENRTWWFLCFPFLHQKLDLKIGLYLIPRASTRLLKVETLLLKELLIAFGMSRFSPKIFPYAVKFFTSL